MTGPFFSISECSRTTRNLHFTASNELCASREIRFIKKKKKSKREHQHYDRQTACIRFGTISTRLVFVRANLDRNDAVIRHRFFSPYLIRGIWGPFFLFLFIRQGHDWKTVSVILVFILTIYSVYRPKNLWLIEYLEENSKSYSNMTIKRYLWNSIRITYSNKYVIQQ